MEPADAAGPAPGAVSIAEAEDLAARAFARAGVADAPARAAARALTLAEAMGAPTHGLIRVERLAPGLIRLDGGGGLGPILAGRALEEGLAAGLSAGRLAREGPDAHATPGARQDLGHLFLLIDAGALAPPEAWGSRLATIRADLAATPPRAGGGPVRMPGDRAIAALKATRLSGLVLPPALLAELRSRAGA